MTTFTFYFGLRLGQKLYGMTDNLSKTLQKEKMSALSGKNLSELTIKTIQRMRNDKDFLLFFEAVKKGASKIEMIEEPTLPRKRKRPNYSILTYIEGHENGKEDYHPNSPVDHFKQIYFDALDNIINAIKDRFDQPGYQVSSDVEQLLLKAISKESYGDELRRILETYSGDFDSLIISSELDLLLTIFEENSPCNFEEIIGDLQSTPQHLYLICNVITIIRLVLTNGSTSATAERSFSMARRMKTWLRSTITQKRFNSLAVLNTHKEILDELSLVEVENDFVDGRSNRRNEFGVFLETDLSL